jgi:uncharacterized protein YkwD
VRADRISRFFSLLALGALLLLPVGAETFSLPVPETKGEQNFELERETFALINDYRRAHDLAPLAWNAAIAEAARGHSRDMAEGRVDFGHGGFGDRVDRLRKLLPDVRGAGENVLYTDDPNDLARNAVSEWLHSPAHLHNIRGDFNCSGIGVWESREGAIYFTQIFVKLVPVAAPAAAE